MIDIVRADLDDPELAAFLRDHLAEMAPTAPAESRHALDLHALRAPTVRLWVAKADGHTVGTLALVALGPDHDELKSMRTAPSHRGRGIATQLLAHALADARARGVRQLSLETGADDFFAPAREMYRRAGFAVSGPFGGYVEDPFSVFMTRFLTADAEAVTA